MFIAEHVALPDSVFPLFTHKAHCLIGPVPPVVSLLSFFPPFVAGCYLRAATWNPPKLQKSIGLSKSSHFSHRCTRRLGFPALVNSTMVRAPCLICSTPLSGFISAPDCPATAAEREWTASPEMPPRGRAVEARATLLLPESSPVPPATKECPKVSQAPPFLFRLAVQGC